MAPTIFLGAGRIEEHFEGVALQHGLAQKGQPRHTDDGAAAGLVLEVEVLDIGLRENERRPQQDFAAVNDVQLAQLACVD